MNKKTKNKKPKQQQTKKLTKNSQDRRKTVSPLVCNILCAAEQIWYGHTPRLIPSVAVW